MPKAKAALKWLAIGLGGFLVAVAAGGGLGYGWLQSDNGRDWLARQIEEATSTPGEIELSIGTLEGSLPENLVARNIVLRDAAGTWLTAAAVEVDWRPWRLLGRTLEIEALTVSAVDLSRLPAAPEESASTGAPDDLLGFPFKVRIGKLAVDEIALGEPVLGQAARLTLAGEAARRDDGTLSASLDLRRVDETEGHLSAKLIYEVESDSLTVEAEAASAPGGLVATLLGIPDLPRAELRLAGSGPLAAWDGDFALSLGDVAQAKAEIGLQRGDNGELDLRLQGQSDVTPPSAATVWSLIAGRTEVTLEAAWQDARRLRLQHFTAANGALSLSASGTVEPDSGALDMKLTAAASQGAALAALLDLDRLDRLSAEIALTGTLGKPDAQVELRADGIATPDFETAALTATGSVTAQNDLLGRAPVLAFDLQGSLDAPRLPGAEAVNEVIGDQLAWAIEGAFHLDSAMIDIAALRATADAVVISASGPFNANDGTAALDVILQATDLNRLQPLTEITLGGQARLAGPLAIERFGSRIAAELQGRWEQPSSDIALLGLAAAKGMDLAARLVIEDSEVRIEEATARSAAASLKSALTVTADTELRDASYSLTLPEAAVLSDAMGAELAGPATVEGAAAGPFDALDLKGTARVGKITVDDQVLSDISSTYQLRLSGADIDGPVTLALSSPYGPVEARSELSLRQETLTLAALQAKLPDTAINGKVSLPLDGGEPVAELRAEIADLGPWLRLAGLSGRGKGTIDLHLNGPDQATPVMASADFSEITVVIEENSTPLRTARVTLDLQAQDPALQQAGSFKIGVETLRWNRLILARLDLDGKGSASALDYRLSAAGDWLKPFDMRAAGRLTQQNETLAIALAEAGGQLFGEPLELRGPAMLTLAPTETRLENLALVSGDASATADARLGDGRIEMTATVDALPMILVNAFRETGIDGRTSATLNIEGPLADPRGTARLTSTGLRPRDSEDLPELDLTVNAEWRSGRLKLDGQLAGAELAAARFIGDAPLQLTADGSSLEVPPDAPLSAQLDWSSDIATIFLFVPQAQHQLGGNATIAVTVSGTAGKPKLNGSVNLDQGRYENLEYGTVLADLSLAAQISDDRVTLASLAANDGSAGKMTGEGNLIIDPAQQFPFDISLAFDKFHALRRDDVSAVAAGSVKIDGNLEAPRVEARITTDTVEISLYANLPPDVARLDIIEVKGGEIQQPPQDAEVEPAFDAALDILVDMPRRIFVRGRGLDSEWAGRISVQGSTADPVISGEVDLVRGQLSVVGKPFELRAGKVVLPKSKAGQPSLDVTAVHEGKDLEVTARMSGPLSQPELELTSSPELPRDEIISRVLFNKSAASLSGIEAAQLALALGDLTGGSGNDLLGFARRSVGLDVLRVESAEGEAATLETGKYLTDEVYVGVKQGTTSQSSSAGVAVELTPNITLESEVTGSGANKSGVRFQWDY